MTDVSEKFGLVKAFSLLQKENKKYGSRVMHKKYRFKDSGDEFSQFAGWVFMITG